MNATSQTCSAVKCQADATIRGRCKRHHSRHWRTGSDQSPPMPHIENLPSEEWLPVVGYEGYYEVSDHGRVKRMKRKVLQKNGVERTVPGKLLSPSDYRGYKRLYLCMNGKRTLLNIAHLVLEAFVGPRPEPNYHACHNNGDRGDNRLENLRWDTASGNMLDMAEHGTNYNLNKTHCPKGHMYDANNTGPKKWANGIGRRCLTCHRNAERARKLRSISETKIA